MTKNKRRSDESVVSPLGITFKTPARCGDFSGGQLGESIGTGIACGDQCGDGNASSFRQTVTMRARNLADQVTVPRQKQLARDRHDLRRQDARDLRCRRRVIELFFRWVKRVLDIKHFLGRSEHAARIQIATALIAFLLLRFAQATQKAVTSPLEFARLVRQNLMHRRSIGALRRPPDPIPRICIDQWVLL